MIVDEDRDQDGSWVRSDQDHQPLTDVRVFLSVLNCDLNTKRLFWLYSFSQCTVALILLSFLDCQAYHED